MFSLDVLQASTLFMTHHLYGSSLLVLFDLARSDVLMRIIDIRTLVDRGHSLDDHRLAPDAVPLLEGSISDGYLTGLANLACFLEGEAHATAQMEQMEQMES